MESQGFVFHIQEKGQSGYDFFYHQTDPQEYCIGRDVRDTSFSTIQVQLQDKTVSRNHCRIFLNPDSKWMIEDLDSKNGTWVQENCNLSSEYKRVGKPIVITADSVLKIGETTIRLRLMSKVDRRSFNEDRYYEQISA
ncbi:MAG: FHA domain-containing protein [Magnetococcales bacterium]|nr:FHA domain-containing protein [Magnetococcales bacterium]